MVAMEDPASRAGSSVPDYARTEAQWLHPGHQGSGIHVVALIPCSILLASMVWPAFGHATLQFGSVAMGALDPDAWNDVVLLQAHTRTLKMNLGGRIFRKQRIKSLGHEVGK